MSLKSTLESTKARLDALLSYANETTGENDTSIGDAIQTLCAGYGGGGVEVYESSYGNFYYEDTVVTATPPNSAAALRFSGCEHMKSFSAPNWNQTIQMSSQIITNNPNLESLILPKYRSVGHYNFESNKKLKTFQLGSIGYPVTSISQLAMRFMTQSDLTITVYVDASSIADAPSGVTNGAPWGATNATIIYRNSTTGEILS